MLKRNWIYCGMAVILVVIIGVGARWYSHSMSEKNMSQALKENKELEEQLRAREKQVDFYYTKVNELIAELTELKQKDGLSKGEEAMEWQNQLVWDALDSEEYQKILAEYREYYGVIDEDDIPKTETLGGLKYKVEESISQGYDLLPHYYGWTHVLMNLSTREFEEVDALFKEHFGQRIPTEQIGGTMEELIDIVNKSVKEGRNLLPEYYN